MKSKMLLFFAILICSIFSAQQMKEYNFGEPFKISYPAGYVKSYDLNDVAAAQFSSPVNEKYSIVIQTEKNHLAFYQLAFTDLVEAGAYYSKTIKDGLIDDASLNYVSPKGIKMNGHNAVESTIEGSFVDEESGLTTKLFYNVTIVETVNHYYQIISWCAAKDKDKNLVEFRKIASSFKEGK